MQKRQRNTSRCQRRISRLNRKPEKTNYLSIILFGFILIISYFYFANPFKTLAKKCQPFPYVFDVLFHQTLDKYTDSEQHNSTFVVHGPKGIGKTSGLKKYQQELLDSGRLAIDLDFVEVSEEDNLETFYSFISGAVIDAINRINTSNVKTNLIKQVVRKRSPASFITKDFSGKIHFVKTKDSTMKRLATHLLSSLKTNNKGSTLFDMLEKLGDALRPVFIVHEPEKIIAQKGCKNFCTDKSKLAEQLIYGINNENKCKTGVILDLSDQTLLPEFVGKSFSFVRVFEFDPDVAFYEIVAKRDLMTAVQFKTIFNTFGGIGSYFVSIRDLMEKGFAFNDAIREKITELKVQLYKEANSYENSEEAKNILLNVVGRHPVMPNITHPFTQQLIKHRMFSYLSERMDVVEPATSGIEDALVELKKSDFKLPSDDLLL